MKKLTLLVALTAASFAGAQTTAYHLDAYQVIAKGRGTLVNCATDPNGKILAKTLAGKNMLCAKTRYDGEDTREFLDIWYSNDLLRPWEESEHFTSALMQVGETYLGVILFPDGGMVVWHVKVD